VKVLRCLSIRQPWATAILELGKDVENRSWGTAYRGLLVIHASAKSEGLARNLFAEILPKAVCANLSDDDFTLGAILGVVDLVDCTDESDSDWADWESAWYWIVKNPRKLERPIPCKGRLGLWAPPEHAMAALKKLI